MEDFERYGDYDEIEEEQPSKNPLSLILKIVSTLLILTVVGVIGMRMYTFNHYPKAMKQLYFTTALSEYYNGNDGNVSAITQSLRAPYDNPDEGNFFADHLIVIPEINELQICMRYNISVADTLVANYGLAGFDTENTEQFSFRLWRSSGESGYETGSLTAVLWDSYAMYRYAKLVFDGVELDGAEWIRLEIFVSGITEPFMIAVYENNEGYSKFEEYKLSKGERP